MRFEHRLGAGPAGDWPYVIACPGARLNPLDYPKKVCQRLCRSVIGEPFWLKRSLLAM